MLLYNAKKTIKKTKQNNDQVCLNPALTYHHDISCNQNSKILYHKQLHISQQIQWSGFRFAAFHLTAQKEKKDASKFSPSKIKRCHWPSKATQIKPATTRWYGRHAPIPNSPGGWAVLAAAGVDDGLVVIETAKGKFLPDGLSLIPLGLPRRRKMTLIQLLPPSAAWLTKSVVGGHIELRDQSRASIQW